jgi:protein O-mannosyl-transferase
VVGQFSRRTNYYPAPKNCQAFLREKQTLFAIKKSLQNAAMSRPRLIALLLAFGTLLVYMPAANHGFSIYDDSDYVTENRVVQNGLTWAGIKWAFTTWHASNWHPLTWISHMLDCQLAGLNPSVPHCVNILFHAANSVLLFALLLRLTNLIWPAAFVAALFAWHPLHVESVAWISERKDVLSTFFALLTLLSYTKYAKENSRRSFWLALIFSSLGLLSKPMLVTLPFVLMLLDYWPLKRFNASTIQPLIVEKIPFFALTIASCTLTFLAQHTGGAVVSMEKVPLHYRLENAPLAYALYLWKMIWPVKLAIVYPLGKISASAVAVSAAILILISAAAWLARKRSPYLLFGWLWFLGTLVPVIGLVQVGSAAMADRYTYFSLIGIFVAIAFGVRDLANRFQFPKIILIAAAGLILAACLILTHEQLNYWRNDETLFRHAIAVTKDNGVAHLNLGFALEKENRNADAMNEYRADLKLEPDRAEAHNNLANLLDDAGKTGDAAAEFQEALRANPKFTAAHNNFGTLLVELGRYDEAMKHYDESARLEPDDWHAPFLAGKALLKQGRDAEAIPYFRRAVSLDPDNLQMLTFLAQVLASDENPKVRDGKTAFVLASKANALTGGVQPVMLDALAMAYAETGNFADAQNAAQDALKLATTYNATNNIAGIRQRLQLYENRQPFRQSFINTARKN